MNLKYIIKKIVKIVRITNSIQRNFDGIHLSRHKKWENIYINLFWVTKKLMKIWNNLIQNQLEISRKVVILLNWTHNIGAINLSVVKMYSAVDSIINAFSLPLIPCDPKRNVSTIVASVWFNKERLMLLALSKRVSFDLRKLSSGKRSEQLL